MIEETLCPLCNGKMISRVNSKTGSRFWGCADFPVCKGTRDSMGRSKQDKREASDVGEMSEFGDEVRWDRK